MHHQPPPCKSLRILVADQECTRRSMIENDLIGLGYYRVTPAICFSDLITLTHYSPDPFERFDLVVINAELVTAAGVKALDFCLENARLRHVLVYDSGFQRRLPRTFNQSPSQQIRLINKINLTQLVDFLSLIDPSFDLRSVNAC